MREYTGWRTPDNRLSVPHLEVHLLRRMLRHAGNSNPVRDLMQYWMLKDMDDLRLHEACDLVNAYIRGGQIRALAREDLHLLPKKAPHGIVASERPLTNLVLVRKVVGMALKKEERTRLRRHRYLPPSQFAMWPSP